MITKYTYGNPIETGAILKNLKSSNATIDTHIDSIRVDVSTKTICIPLLASDIVYGLGEAVRGINKRGWIYRSKCSDDACHREDTHSLYGAHNFIIVDSLKPFGLFIDTPGYVTFDIGYTNQNEILITFENFDFDLYLLEEETPSSITKEFRALIGQSYIPPKWAFGYGQSRWGYKNEADIREIANKHKEHHIPLDMIYMDIDYMKDYKDFTVDKEAFPDLKTLQKDLLEDGIHLVPIIDAGVKIENGYEVYEEGVKNNYFCKDASGNDFVVGVWPGRVHLPDMLNDKAREWFGNWYKVLLDDGIEGFWNDMNEPALFYSEENLKNVFEKLDSYKSTDLDLNSFFEFQDLVSNLANNEEDYKRFYHNYHGRKVRHDMVHNIYGYHMTKAASDAFERFEPNKRILMFSRSSYIGMHRNGGIWTGDNLSWWSHLKLNLQMMPSLNMCGFLYTGADIGGFGAHTTEDLLLRWLAFACFTPLMRNHAAMGTRNQEAYQFENTETFAGIIGLRYRFLPYIYSEFVKCALNNEMYMKPLAFEYIDDAFAQHVEDQLLVGESLMIAPVVEQNAIGRTVYLPGTMQELRFQGNELKSKTILEKGHHFIHIALDEVVIFLRPNHILPLSKGGNNTYDVDYKNLELLHFGEDVKPYVLYDDDGYTKDYHNNSHYTTLLL